MPPVKSKIPLPTTRATGAPSTAPSGALANPASTVRAAKAAATGKRASSSSNNLAKGSGITKKPTRIVSKSKVPQPPNETGVDGPKDDKGHFTEEVREALKKLFDEIGGEKFDRGNVQKFIDESAVLRGVTPEMVRSFFYGESKHRAKPEKKQRQTPERPQQQQQQGTRPPQPKTPTTPRNAVKVALKLDARAKVEPSKARARGRVGKLAAVASSPTRMATPSSKPGVNSGTFVIRDQSPPNRRRPSSPTGSRPNVNNDTLGFVGPPTATRPKNQAARRPPSSTSAASFVDSTRRRPLPVHTSTPNDANAETPHRFRPNKPKSYLDLFHFVETPTPAAIRRSRANEEETQVVHRRIIAAISEIKRGRQKITYVVGDRSTRTKLMNVKVETKSRCQALFEQFILDSGAWIARPLVGQQLDGDREETEVKLAQGIEVQAKGE